MTQASEHYVYRSYLETLLTYGTDATASHLGNAYGILTRATCTLATPGRESDRDSERCIHHSLGQTSR